MLTINIRHPACLQYLSHWNKAQLKRVCCARSLNDLDKHYNLLHARYPPSHRVISLLFVDSPLNTVQRSPGHATNQENGSFLHAHPVQDETEREQIELSARQPMTSTILFESNYSDPSHRTAATNRIPTVALPMGVSPTRLFVQRKSDPRTAS